jgi:aspartate kinase
MLDAEIVVVWKDVPGLLIADPKWLPDAVKWMRSHTGSGGDDISGAKVIHPKTSNPCKTRIFHCW